MTSKIPSFLRDWSRSISMNRPNPSGEEEITGACNTRMLWATGFCIAYNTMKAITGPRVVKVDKVPTASPAAQATSARVGNTPDACVWQHKAFQDCINTYGGDINYCQFYMDMLSEYRKSGSATSALVGF
ncbi:hypothetical protein Tco_0206844 [Tanacetum coccineum]